MSGTSEGASLAAVFVASAPPERRSELEALEGLESLLKDHLEAARAAWPGVPLEAETFVRHVARHVPAQGPLEVLRQLHGADLYLACACARGEPEALQCFERHVLQKVPARLGALSRATVDDVLQVLRERLLVSRSDGPPRVADYSGRGPLLAWVRISAARVASELSTRGGRQQLFDEPPEALARMLASTGDPERELLKKDSREVLMEALRKALAAMPERERGLLRLHHLHGFTMDRLATMYGDSRSGIARKVAQARERLLKLTRTELSSRLRMDGNELESLLGLVNSRLDLSLNRLMD